MTEHDITRIERSWALVLPIADEAVATFYERLFALHPRAARMFSCTDMAVQRQRLASAIDGVVCSLRSPASLCSTLRDLGARHATYGVLDEDFTPVGQALLHSLKAGLGSHWTEETEAAWIAAWDEISGAMREGLDMAGTA